MQRYKKRRTPTMTRLTDPQIEVVEEIMDEDGLESLSDAQRLLMRLGAKARGKVRKWDSE